MKKLYSLLYLLFIVLLSLTLTGCERNFLSSSSTENNLINSESDNITEKFSIISHEIKPDQYGYFEIYYTIQNVSDETLIFKGISIKEFDHADTILNDYYSYNKNAMFTEVNSNQKLRLKLTFDQSDGIARIESFEYVYGRNENELINERFDIKYTVNVE